jgi:16S rRNA (cytidine1402-2'-O)-methyltransferase
MAGILYVVATPIGNLEDVTLRALRVLRDVSLVAAEDTRRTARLLQHYSISTPTTSLHEHNERGKTPKLIERLARGESIALVSDAGTPVVSDPGETLIAAARGAGIRVESVPGASAVMAAVAASGLPVREFAFVGFSPSRSRDRKLWLEGLLKEPRLVVFFEAPHRIIGTLTDIGALVGLQKTIGIARELTKTHEELVVQPIEVLLKHFREPVGEFTVLLPPTIGPPGPARAELDPKRLAVEFGELTNNGRLKRREALKVLADRHGLAVNQLYKLLGSAGS